MNQPIAGMLLVSGRNDWRILPIYLAVAAIGVAAPYWRFFVQWLNGIRSRNWPTISAVIDIVSVVPQERDHQDPVYLATLTYFYRNPELQTGEYSRLFEDEAEAQAWAASYKGCAVMVHVDPRDPSRSVLCEEDL